MVMKESELLIWKYPGLTREEVEGKTEEQVKWLWEHKAFERCKCGPYHEKIKEAQKRIEPCLDKILENAR